MRKWMCIILFSVLPFVCFSEVDIAQLTELAKEGDVASQFALGVCCDIGDGVPEDDVEAAKWYRLAAEQGDVTAQYNLGGSYLYGNGVLQDSAKAYEWFLAAAKQGYPEAQYHVAVRYLKGDGVVENITETLRWYRKSAEQGFAPAQYDLALSYHSGRGVPIDCKEAVRWYRLAAEQGYADAQLNLGVCYSHGDGVLQDCKEAVGWYRLAAEQGHAGAQNNMGLSYYTGEGVLEDYVEAYAWYVIAAMNGSEQGAKNKEISKNQFHSAQIAAGQARAKEIMAIIERKKQVAELDPDEVPAANISPAGFGSGLLVNNGYVLTCWHVVENAKKISISCQGKNYAATVVQKDPSNDIAVLRVSDAPVGVPLSFSDVKLGENIFTLGFPHPDLQGFDVKFTTGSISALTGPGSTPVYYQISAPLQSGNSGGPLFDEQGNLIGMVAAKLDSLKMLAATGDLTQNVNYAIKADYLIPILKTVNGITIQPAKTEPVNLLSLVEDLKKSVVMIKVY